MSTSTSASEYLNLSMKNYSKIAPPSTFLALSPSTSPVVSPVDTPAAVVEGETAEMQLGQGQHSRTSSTSSTGMKFLKLGAGEGDWS